METKTFSRTTQQPATNGAPKLAPGIAAEPAQGWVGQPVSVATLIHSSEGKPRMLRGVLLAVNTYTITLRIAKDGTEQTVQVYKNAIAWITLGTEATG